jgi:hypothetical protein
LLTFAPRKARSSASKPISSGAIRSQGQRQLRARTTVKSTVVMVIVPATAMP